MAAFVSTDFTDDFDIGTVKRPTVRGRDYKITQYSTARPGGRNPSR